MRRETPPRAARAVRARGAAPLPAPVAGDARDDGHQPLRHLHDEVQPARQRASSRRGPRSRELHPHQDDDTLQGVLEIVHGLDLILRELSGMDRFVFQAGGGADAAYTARLRHPRLPRGARRARAARRDRSPRSRRTRATRRRPRRPASTSSRCRSRRTATRRSRRCGPRSRDRTAALMVNNPDDMGIYNPHIKRVGRDRARRRRALLLRPRQLQRRDGQDPRARARLRRLHVHAAQDVRRAQGRRRPGGRRVRLQRRARAVPARPARRPRATARYALDASDPDERRPGARVPRQRAAGRQGLRLGARDGRRRASARPPTSRCWPTTTWRTRLLAIRGVDEVASRT